MQEPIAWEVSQTNLLTQEAVDPITLKLMITESLIDSARQARFLPTQWLKRCSGLCMAWLTCYNFPPCRKRTFLSSISINQGELRADLF